MEKQLMEAYRNVFSSPDGELVLADILSLLGHFANDPEYINVQCIAVSHTILSRIGAYSTKGTRNYVQKLIEAGLDNSVTT